MELLGLADKCLKHLAGERTRPALPSTTSACHFSRECASRSALSPSPFPCLPVPPAPSPLAVLLLVRRADGDRHPADRSAQRHHRLRQARQPSDAPCSSRHRPAAFSALRCGPLMGQGVHTCPTPGDVAHQRHRVTSAEAARTGLQALRSRPVPLGRRWSKCALRWSRCWSLWRPRLQVGGHHARLGQAADGFVVNLPWSTHSRFQLRGSKIMQPFHFVVNSSTMMSGTGLQP